MNIQAQKMEIIEMILETKNSLVLESIKMLLKKESFVDFWETLPQDQKDDILLGIEEIETGNTVDFEDFMRKHRV